MVQGDFGALPLFLGFLHHWILVLWMQRVMQDLGSRMGFGGFGGVWGMFGQAQRELGQWNFQLALPVSSSIQV